MGTTLEGITVLLLDDMSNSPAKYISIFSLSALFLFLRWTLTPSHDPREPPLLKPKIPIIGHIIGILGQGIKYHLTLSNNAKSKRLGIVTIPMANQKAYVITSPAMIQAAMRHRNLSFDTFILETSKHSLGFEKHEYGVIGETIDDYINIIHSSLMGENLRRMNRTALSFLAGEINNFPTEGVMEVDNLWLWLRRLITLATSNGLFGSQHNPFSEGKNPGLVDDLWLYDTGFFHMATQLFPKLLRPEAVKARGRIQDALVEYYRGGHDQTGPGEEEECGVSALIARRAAEMRNAKPKWDHKPIGRMELAMAHVSAVNTMPTLFWFVVFVFSRPEVVRRARAECEGLVAASSTSTPEDEGTAADGDGKRKKVVNVSLLESKAPFLVSCYRETTRLSNVQLGTRRVTDDTILADTNEKGERIEYLLKKGADVMMPAIVTHNSKEVWGEDVDEFKGDRFLNPGPASSSSSSESKSGTTNTQQGREEERKKRGALIPFGGGKHLCPGRNFAFTENLGLVAALLVGFDVEGLAENEAVTKGFGSGYKGTANGGDKVYYPDPAHAVVQPLAEGEGYKLRIKRRKGWEDVEWAYVS